MPCGCGKMQEVAKLDYATSLRELVLKRPSPLRQFQAVRRSKMPEGGWRQDTITRRQRQLLQREIVMTKRIVLAQAIPTFSRAVLDLFNEQIRQVIRQGENTHSAIYGTRAAGISPVGIVIGSNLDIWREAIEDVFSQDAVLSQATLRLKPAMDSVLGSMLDKTSRILTDREATVAASAKIRQISNDMARLVTRINETTRKRMRLALERGFDENLTVAEMARKLRGDFRNFNVPRISTIARTEMGRAADAADIIAMQESGAVSHVSVIGCEAIEPGIPEYMGVPTCNIMNVPIEDSGMLEFHINHTGTVVPEAFFDSQGNRPTLEVMSGGA